MKDTFVFYKGWKKAVEDLPDSIRLEIYESVIEYATTGSLPDLKAMAKTAFNFIKADIDRDTEKYMSIVSRNKSNGSKGGRPKKNPLGFLETQRNPEKPKKADNEYDNDNEDEYDNEDDNKLPDGNCRVEAPTCRESGHVLFINEFNAIRGSKFRPIEKVKRQLNARLKDGYTADDILNALKNAMADKFHIESGFKYLTPEFITRSDKLEKFHNTANKVLSAEERISAILKKEKNDE